MKHTSVALGTFDGVHIGHREVLRLALDAARNEALTPLVQVFDEHPLSVLRGEAPPLLLENATRTALLRAMGFDVCSVSFAHLRNMEPETFVREVLCGSMHARAVSCGFNYRFGKNGEGDVTRLRALCTQYGIELFVSEPVIYDGTPVSSTRIRRALENGDTAEANKMLGRPFSFSAPVCHGNAIGRELGFPTANQTYPASLVRPRFGVYATRVELDGETFDAITNIGVRPTLPGDTLCSETHILGIRDSDLYGRMMSVSLLRFIRPERKFDSVPDVFRQVREDIRTAYPHLDVTEYGGRHD